VGFTSRYFRAGPIRTFEKFLDSNQLKTEIENGKEFTSSLAFHIITKNGKDNSRAWRLCAGSPDEGNL